MHAEPECHDVLIVGGGLAGLTLALQLAQRCAGIDVLVLERRTHPVPVAAHKVGESTVEIGAHYFRSVLGLAPHLQQQQLRKFGFRFFFTEGRRDIDQVTEIGASQFLAVPSHQIDRGIFENFLVLEARRRGIRVIDSALVRSLPDTAALAPAQPGQLAPHVVTYERDGACHAVAGRWLIDASGRAGLLKRKLGLDEPNRHAAHAVWFRVNHRIRIDDWSDNPQWRARCSPPARWLSTNHLVGAGYWVWLIPLASGSHSVGIVADPRLHPLESMDTFERAMQWFKTYQPLLFDALDDKRDTLQDFAFFRRFSYGCKQVFSAQRWALTGEAGLFLDPFYSPGSDFIAIGNTYVTELIARDRAGLRWQAQAAIYDRVFHSFYDSTLALYVDQYPLFGDPEVLPVKVIWDYAYYWGVLSQLFFQGRIADLEMLARLRVELEHCRALNLAVQSLLRAWSALSRKRNLPVMHDQAALAWFAELNRSLTDQLDDTAFHHRLQRNVRQLGDLAREILERACGDHPGLDGNALHALLMTGPEGPDDPDGQDGRDGQDAPHLNRRGAAVAPQQMLHAACA